MSHQRALVIVACAISSSLALSCNDQLTLELATASVPFAKCDAVNAFEKCLSESAAGATDGDNQLIASVKAANGGCLPPTVKPALKTANGVLKVLVGADSDFVLERQGKPALSFVGLTDDMAEVKEAVDVKLAQSIVDINANLAASEAKVDQKIQDLDETMTQSLETVDDKVASVDRKLVASQSTVDEKLAAVDVKLASVDQQVGAVDQKVADSTAARVAALKALETKLMKSIKDLESKTKCSHNGELQPDGKTCKCVGDFGGPRCAMRTPADCTALATGTYKFKNGKTGFCYGSGTAGSGWELIFNLASSKRPTLEFREGFWTESKRTLGTLGMDEDCKGDAFYEKKNYNQVMIVAHDAGSLHGEAVYDVRGDMKAKTFHQHFQGDQNKRLTDNKKSGTGEVKKYLKRNPHRPQTLWGDTFVDRAEYLIINKNGGWNSGRNRNRIATSVSNSNYGHTFAGIGGWHEHGVGSWHTYYESAPISSYCSIIRGYGSDNNYKGSGAYGGSCRQDFAWVKVDYAIFAR